MSNGKLYKLLLHQKTQQKSYAAEDLAFSRDFLNLEVNDVIEIYNPDEENSPRLLLHVSKGSLRDDFPQKDAISLETSIANTFLLRSNSDIIVNKIVNPSIIELDSIELTFKDQYLGRSEMWRLKNNLINTCVYLNKKIEFCSSSIRCNVYELWSKGEKVTSGKVSESTKIVYRSSSSMVYLFIQMSSEMWEFDITGDLYFEKAVNGFLGELFNKWKKNGSNHEVTIVLFSRIFYNATSLEDFPELMKECLQIDHKKRFYEDFYRVAAQNEKMDDWLNILTNLRQMFVHYEEDLLNLYKVDGSQKIPTGVISRSAEGNFLEVLNMSLNVFEKHYLDRSFDRTGQLSVVVTPGVGVFEVDRELTNVTMQRIIDNGVGSDLVCIGEQPLHAVPLLKFHSKGLTNSIYSLPHWINLSFYSTNKRYGYGSYSPRIKLPLLTNTNSNNQNATSNESTVISGFHTCTNYDQIRIPKLKLSRESENMWPNSVYDYDDYDANIFTLPNNPNANSTQQSQSLQRRTFQHHRKKIASAHVHNRSNPNEIDIKLFRRQNSEPDMHYEEHDISPSITTTGAGGGKLNESTSGYDFFQSRMNDRDRSSPIVSHRPNSGFASSSPILHETQTIPIPPAVKHFVKKSEHLYSSSFGALNIEMKPKKMGPSVGLLNKDRLFFDDYFQPTSIGQTTSSKMLYSSNSPSKDLRPIFTQQQLKNLQKPSKSLINPFDPSNQRITLTSSRRRWTHIFPRGPTGQLMQEHHQHSKLDIVHEGNGLESPDASESPVPSRATTSTTRKVSESGFLKERKLTLLWSATGEQSWSSSLKTGVDWKSLTIPACLPITTDYSPEDSSLDLDYVVSNYNLLPDDDGSFMSSKEVFLGLISQRLAQGFQLIIPHSTSDSVSSVSKKIKSTSSGQSTPLLRSNTIPKIEEKEEYFMSIGRIFHKLNLTGDKITVTRYRPKHPYPALKIHYRYRFKAPHNQTYAISWSEFETDRLENFNWNYLDNYICTRGDIEYPLMDSLKFWRFRIYLLPSYQSATKRILENSNEFCNIYTELNDDEKFTLLNGYLNFIEICINRIKRDGPRSRGSQGALIFRERVGSNRLTERPQLKSTSKPSETENAVAADNTVTNLELTDDSAFQDIKIKSTASLQEIIEAIKSSNSGFPFITSSSLRKFLFVSCDSIFWLIEHMESIATESQAIEKFNEMLNKQLICHASGDTKHPFLNGFYLYNIVSNDPKDPSQFDKLFKNEWMEVEIEAEQIINKNFIESSIIFNVPKAPSSSTSNENNEITPPIDNFFVSHLNPLDEKRKASISKECFLELDITKKSERSEWGHLKYQSLYRPSEAYSLEITWLQGTGSIITDLIQGWARKAQQCNLQLIPIPSDPFALPYTYNSDSLRGPIFIPLNTECLLENQSYLFEEFPESTWEKRSFLFQEAIIFHFGFIKCSFNNANGVGSNYQSKYSKDQSSALEDENHYVHVTGNMFILIPTGAKQKDSILIRRPSSVTSQSKASFESGSNNLHEDYITRHVSGAKQGLSKSEINQKSDKNGFLWFWNYMISKRWKTSSTLALGDDAFMDRLRKDFQAFCSNDQNRLKNFWNQCRQNAKLTSTINKKTNLMVKEEEINVPELVDTHSQFFALDLRFKNDFCETRKI